MSPDTPQIPTALVFPGQGSQRVGMGRAWAEVSEKAREVFHEADRVLGMPLCLLCWEGPEELLNQTANTQPALLTASIAILRALEERSGEFRTPLAVAGHSLGEYSALVAAEALSFEDALRLVRRRGELMQAAVPLGAGAMAAILGMSADEVTAVAAAAVEGHPDEVCAVANFNSPEQTVLAGHQAAIGRAIAIANERGAKKSVLLPVSAPFHSALMRPARIAMTEQLEATSFQDPRVPVVTNVDAQPVTTGAAARDALIRQIDSPVRWVESVRWMAGPGGVERMLEVGPGAVLSGLNRRIAEVKTAPLGEPEQWTKLEAAAAKPREGGADAATGR
jgi:[acyl-carrier-protein] S-malonyltransferase